MAKSLTVLVDQPRKQRARPVVALVGNPNAGKTTLFNALTGLRASTANYAGTTIEKRSGVMSMGADSVEIIDLPGLYGLTTGSIEERVARDVLLGVGPADGPPDAAIVVIDATNLARNLYLAGQVRELNIPMVIALNMSDLADRQGLRIDVTALQKELGAPVVKVSARTGSGLPLLRRELDALLGQKPAVGDVPPALRACGSCGGCPHAARYAWAEDVNDKVCQNATLSASKTEALDRYLTHPVLGLLVFALVMSGTFVSIFWLAAYPMDWIDSGFAQLQDLVAGLLPANDFRDLLVDGVIGGVGGVLVFLPQICILFFLLSLLEDTGYLARAALVMDKLMRRVGLPGRAFVPMLSAHACAIPAIMSTKVIEDRRDRLVAILVLPLLTCSARLPVYVMIAALLFANHPLQGGLMFAGAYGLGIVAALGTAWLLKRTILPGKSAPFLLELPTFKLPSLRTALLTVVDRAVVFVKRAGTIILLISVILWAMSTYPKLPEDRVLEVAEPESAMEYRQLVAQRDALSPDTDAEQIAALQEHIDVIYNQQAMRYSIAGRAGRALEPVFGPLGFNWQINVGVLTSFAARETLVSTLSVVYGSESDDNEAVVDKLASATRSDGAPVFNFATGLSLLVFFVLAMQCLPTQAVTRRESGSWKWALFQLGYMTCLAYFAALITYQVMSRLA